MKITVPATSANIGPGFDSVGVAVSKYLTIEVLEPADAWHIEHDLGDIPSDENNLLISTALQVKSDLQPHKFGDDIRYSLGAWARFFKFCYCRRNRVGQSIGRLEALRRDKLDIDDQD